MDIQNINFSIQKYLLDNDYYKGNVDGKIGPESYKAIDKALADNGIDSSGWPNARKLIAAEQLLYKANKIEVGKLDGKVGPSTQNARDVWNAKLVLTWRDKATEILDTVTDLVPFGKVKLPKITPTWPTQSDVSSFYGKVGSNQDTCNLPFPMRIAWDKKSTLKSYSCHKKVKDSMERVWQNTFDYYGYEKIKELGLDLFGGCLNVRKMRGGSNYSMHSWGIAIDIDPDRNSLRTTWKNAQMSKPEYKKFVEFWYAEGAINLGIERNFDPMHFQFARL